MKSTLSVKKNISSQIQKILSNRVDTCRSLLQTTEPHTGIHEARKELKKIRAILRLARCSVSKKTYQKTNAYFRDIARLLSDARDTAALLEVVLTLQDKVQHSKLQSQLNQVANHLMAKKAAVTRYQIHRDQLLHHTLESMSEADDYISNYDIQSEGFAAIGDGLEKVYARGKKMLKVVEKHPEQENFHEWRKRAKYLRYQLNTLREVWPAMMDCWENELHKLTDSLGAEHDLFVLHETILQSKLKDDADWQLLFEFIATHRKTHQEEAQALGRRLYSSEPSQFTHWVQDSWKSARMVTSVPIKKMIEV